MNHRKIKQLENFKKPKKEEYNPYSNDPVDSSCPYCGQSGKGCSYVDGLSRAWARGACKIKNNIK